MSQIIVNTVVAAGIISLIGLSFAFVYNVARFFHFAHGIVFTWVLYGAPLPRLDWVSLADLQRSTIISCALLDAR